MYNEAKRQDKGIPFKPNTSRFYSQYIKSDYNNAEIDSDNVGNIECNAIRNRKYNKEEINAQCLHPECQYCQI